MFFFFIFFSIYFRKLIVVMSNEHNNNNNTNSNIETNNNKFETLKNIFQFEYSFIGNNYFEQKKTNNNNKKKATINQNEKTPEIKNNEDNTTNNKKNNNANISNISLINTNVYCIRLNRLLKSNNKKVRQIIKKIFKLNRIRDLVHAICALYDNCLPDIGASSLYDCICAPKAYTICVVRKEDDSENNNENTEDDDDSVSVYDSNDCLEKIEDLTNQPDSIFAKLFSDDDEDDDELADESSESDEEQDENNFTNGLKSFLEANKKNKSSDNGEKKAKKKSWILKNLIGCATLQRVSTFQLPGQDEWIIDLQLMSVRSKYRGLNIGKYLLNLIQNRDYVGNFDAIVTSSDLDAIKFYEKYGFNIDPILNSKYHMIGDIWTNTTKMCYIPPYCQLIDKYKKKLRDSFLIKKPFVQSIDEILDFQRTDDSLEEKTKRLLTAHELNELNNILGNDDTSYENSCVLELTNMENDFKKWQKLMFSSYQSQTQLFIKLKQEILTLKVKLSAKESLIDDLKVQNSILTKKNSLLKMELDHYTEIEQEEKNYANKSVIKQTEQITDTDTNKNDQEIDNNLDKLLSELKSLSKSRQY
jgi:ribosomal protein S18 acetylase RimI-like enzyme